MSTLKVDEILKRTGTGTITLGQSGDTISIPSGATLNSAGTNTLTGIDNTPAFQVNAGTTAQTISHNTWTKLNLGTEEFDTDSAFASDKFTVPTGKGGKYMFGYGTSLNNLDDGEKLQIKLYKNGSEVKSTQNRVIGSTANQLYFVQATQVLVLSAADYIELSSYTIDEFIGEMERQSPKVEGQRYSNVVVWYYNKYDRLVGKEPRQGQKKFILFRLRMIFK